MVKKSYFGTDGIRGKVGHSPINPEFVLKLGWALGCVVGQGLNKKILIGKDTRISGYMLESALEAGLSAAGVDVRLLGPMPTPAVAYLTQTLRASAGIVISASHNPYYDNGIKIFTADGQKLDDEIELEIESYIQKDLQIVDSALLGKAKRIEDAPGRYIEFCKSTIPSLTRLTALKIVVDCAHGATYHIAPNVFVELGASVITIANEPDGININKDSGSIYPEKLKAKVLEHKADIGIALDGDGDRVVLIDAKGNIINGDKILYIIAKDRQQRGLLHGGVVGTLMSNFGLEKALQALNIEFKRTFVGDRYILEALKNEDWRIGGEPSGHIVCLDKTTTGDGIVSALQVLAIMIKQEKSLHELCEEINLVPQILVNIHTKKADLVLQDKNIKSLIEDMQKSLANDGRVLLRSSGTEPLLRIMVEGLRLETIESCVAHLQGEIQKIVDTYEQ